MRKVMEIVKSTLVGGILFLLPLIILIVIVEKAVHMARAVVGPFVSEVGYGTVFGIGTATIASLFALLLLCLIAGLVARTVVAQGFISWLENSVLGRIPAYGFIKSLAEGVTGIESEEDMIPVAVELDDNTMIGLMTAEQEGLGLVAVYFPSAPTPISGSVLYVERTRVTELSSNTLDVFSAMKKIGADSLDLLAGYRNM